VLVDFLETLQNKPSF